MSSWRVCIITVIYRYTYYLYDTVQVYIGIATCCMHACKCVLFASAYIHESIIIDYIILHVKDFYVLSCAKCVLM